MARPNQDAIDTFVSITGTSEEIAVQKLEERGGDLNEAVNAYFNEGDRTIGHPTTARMSQDDFMDVDDDPIRMESQRPPFSLLSAASNLNPFSLLDPNFRRSFLEGTLSADLGSGAPWVTHPREVREIPIEVKDESGPTSISGSRPIIEEVSETANAHGSEIHGQVSLDEEGEDNKVIPADPGAHSSHNERNDDAFGGRVHGRNAGLTAPLLADATEYSNDIEEEMIQAAIEASKREVEGFSDHQFDVSNQQQSRPEDAELARAVSLSLKTAEQEKILREKGGTVEMMDKSDCYPSGTEELRNSTTSARQGSGSLETGTSSQTKLEAGSSFVEDEGEDVEELPLVRQRSRRNASIPLESTIVSEGTAEDPPPSPRRDEADVQPQRNGDFFHSDEWGGISSEEHDEAVMLEAALFGGIPEGAAYRFRPERNMRPAPRPPSPTLTAQRLIREQQDDEYLASLQADREKELKAMEEAEARRLQEQAAMEAALEEGRKKLLEEEEFEKQLAAKEAALPQEPPANDENAVTLLVRMPDGSRRGRRFLKGDKLQSFFDFIDVGRAVKPGTYRLVRPYPRRAFSDEESQLSLSELGLTSKQEALFLELI
ncbi:hypothetical protein Scep_006506 [Stephania cephalantha]|uniref:UBX domain-containing protein n=1 Tax=Stephania cephalantha TaxID=152367 RepID=A0AAP0K9N7_9MAGN